MHICKKILLGTQELEEQGPITIVAFGDSITHGAVGPGEIDYESVYWNRLRKKIINVRNYVPVNVINAGIGGTTAESSVKRMDSQVLQHNPDLLIVCFGLNDINCSLETYLASLKKILEKGLENNIDTIFMTPNMLNTYTAPDTEPEYLDYSAVTAEYQNSGKMDLYMQNAVSLASDLGVTVCDCYSEWKEIAKAQDTTMLLANRINHPVRKMHELFAENLFNAIFSNSTKITSGSCNTMYMTHK